VYDELSEEGPGAVDKAADTLSKEPSSHVNVVDKEQFAKLKASQS
jgi:hypothetical protein